MFERNATLLVFEVLYKRRGAVVIVMSVPY